MVSRTVPDKILSIHQWSKLLADLTRVLSPGGWLEIIEEDIIFPVVIAPTVTFGRTSKSARQNALKSHAAQQALNKQSLTYPEETRPSAFLTSPARDDANWPAGTVGRSPPLSSIDPFLEGGGLPSPNNSGNYDIPSSYLQYAQAMPFLSRAPLPPPLLNPLVNQIHFIDESETRPFAQDHAVLEYLFDAVFTRRWINLEPTAILNGMLGMEVGLSGVVASEPLEIARLYGPKGPSEADRSSSLSLAAEGGRRGSGGSQTLLDESTVEVDEATRKSGEQEQAIDGDDDTQRNIPPSPPLTPTALSSPATYSGLPSSPGRLRTRPSQRENTNTTTQSGGIRKYPSLALTASLRSMFPDLDSDIARAFHLQRAWESKWSQCIPVTLTKSTLDVVACKEAMWEEFLHDSAVREKEAYALLQSPTSQNTSVALTPSSFLGTVGSMRGTPSGSAIGKVPPTTQLKIGSGVGWGHHRVPTLLDELEWADSDQRRSERERFDILLDRYEM